MFLPERENLKLSANWTFEWSESNKYLFSQEIMSAWLINIPLVEAFVLETGDWAAEVILFVSKIHSVISCSLEVKAEPDTLYLTFGKLQYC